MDDGCEGEFWFQDDPDHLDRNAYYCGPCLDKRIDALQRARELQCDCPPSWFDPTYAGERWDDNY